MRQSKLFTKTRKEAPKDEVAKNAELLIRAGYIHKEMAGVYSYLPLGLRVLNKICNIIREEMNVVGGQELVLTALQDKNIWEKTGRWSDVVVDNWFKTKLKNDTELGLGFTHEEELTNLMRDHIHSFRDLPVYVYQIQTKFRNEARAKSGIMRGREFLMKDLYSFSKDAKALDEFYQLMKDSYMKIFSRVGIGEKTYRTLAPGGSFSKISDEFQTVTGSGEDCIHICEKCRFAINDDYIKLQPTCPQCGNKELKKETSVEVGNIFPLGTKYSEAFGLQYVDESGLKQPIFMGSYGIGIGRLMGTIVEVLADAKGIVWPESVAPFKVHLISLAQGGGDAKNAADALYKKLTDKGVEVLYDERELRAGEKFADSDLLGLPFRVVISDKTVKAGKVEFKRRTEEKSELISEEELFKKVG
ncbi:MAG: aminoacyl--tRNA ligase-related protein [Patescibacteria group bacterium]